jgi:hypothetical protein
VRGRGESVGSAGSATVSTGCQVARRRPLRGFLLPDNTNFGELLGGSARDQAAGWLWHLVVDSASEVPGYASGVGRDTADSGGRDSGLAGQPDIGESGHGQAESAAVYGPAGPVERTDRGKVIDIRPIAGGEDYRVDLLRGSVGPDHPIRCEAFEHPSFVGPASRDRGGVASVVEYSAPVRGAPT